jgi:hypothetical protein
MVVDSTVMIRRVLQDEVNQRLADRRQLEATEGQVWNTSELADDFEVLAFAAPFCVVRRKSDGVLGSLMFQHSPRFYFAFVEDQDCAVSNLTA